MKTARQFVGVDLENLTRSATPSSSEAVRAANWLLDLLQLKPGDVIIVCGNPHNREACEAAASVLGGSVECKAGPNGADLLINSKVAFMCFMNGRLGEPPFDLVTIVSGDGIFASTTAWVKLFGLRVRFIAHQMTLHRTILDVADHVTYVSHQPSIASETK